MTEQPLQLVVVAGMSGAGQTEATRAFEDLGYFVVDNLPPSVLEPVVDLCRQSGLDRAAIVVRPSGTGFFNEFINDFEHALRRQRERGTEITMLFLDASDTTLIRRFEERRRPHPASPNGGIVDGIALERKMLLALKADADFVVDTSGLSPHELRRRLSGRFRSPENFDGLRVQVVSFGFKHGLPTDADLVFDARWLPNPHWVEGLREKTGRDAEVKEYVLEKMEAREYLERIADMLQFLLPGFAHEGKHYLTVAIGCTGGRHRSVVLAEAIAERLVEAGQAAEVQHRDLDR